MRARSISNYNDLTCGDNDLNNHNDIVIALLLRGCKHNENKE